MLKKYCVMLMLLLLFLLPAAATAEGNLQVLVNNETYSFNSSPVIDNGRTLVPMRTLFEALGADVRWEPREDSAIGIRDGAEVRIIVGSNVATVNGMERRLDVPARLIDGTTFIPLRFIGEALGDSIHWDPETGKITIQTNARDVGGQPAAVAYSQTGVGSWYGNEFAGRSTASGERFNPEDFTAAHRNLPFGTHVKVTYLKTGKSVFVRINDRGPHKNDRIIDLSKAAAEAIGLKNAGIGEVLLEILE